MKYCGHKTAITRTYEIAASIKARANSFIKWMGQSISRLTREHTHTDIHIRMIDRLVVATFNIKYISHARSRVSLFLSTAVRAFLASVVNIARISSSYKQDVVKFKITAQLAAACTACWQTAARVLMRVWQARWQSLLYSQQQFALARAHFLRFRNRFKSW